jgi:hypothetical protein
MEVEANRRHTGSSPFSRPPQPRAASTFARPVAAPRESLHAGATGEERRTLERQRRNGGQWFYWIAALSLINAALAFAGQEWRFILGLGVTQYRERSAAPTPDASAIAARRATHATLARPTVTAPSGRPLRAEPSRREPDGASR